MRTALTSAVGLLVGLSLVACASHEPRPVFRAALVIGDRGISVPLPPPSLLAAPQQEVEVEADASETVPGAIAHVEDLRSGVGATAELVDGDTEVVLSLELDLTDNCLEVWLVAPDGARGETRRYHAVIEDEQSIVVRSGCPED